MSDAEIQIPGYDVMFPNSVWKKTGKNLGPAIILDERKEAPEVSEDTPTTSVISMQRFQAPTEEGILDAIQHFAVRYAEGALDPETVIYSHLTQFNEDGIDHLIEREEDLFGLIREVIPRNISAENKKYFEVMGGSLPNLLLETEQAAKYGHIFVRQALAQTSPDDWTLRIKLTDSWKLPSRYEINYLMDREVTTSSVLDVGGHTDKGYSDFVSRIELVYSLLPSSKRVKLLRDSTPEALQGICGGTLKGFFEKAERVFTANKFSDAITSLASIISSARKEE